MCRFLIFLLCCLLLSSCATILNSDSTAVFLYTKEPADIVYNMDTLHTEQQNGLNAVRLYVPRSVQPISLIILSDSLRKRVTLPSKTSPTYRLNYIYFPTLLFDNSSPNRYTYKSPVLFNDKLQMTDSVSKDLRLDMKQRNKAAKKYDVSRFDIPKGSVFLNFSMPFIYPTISSYSPEGSPRLNEDAAFGLAGGVDYFYKKNRFINLTGNIIAGRNNFGYWEGGYDNRDWTSSANVFLSNNHKYKRFSFGYGLSYTYNSRTKDTYIWESEYVFREKKTDSYEHEQGCNCNCHYNNDDIPPMHKQESWKYSGLGAVFNTYFYFTPNFYAGIIYKPTFVRLKAKSGSPFFYEHQISFDFAFKIKLFSGK